MANETSTTQQQERPFPTPAGESLPLLMPKPETATESYPDSFLVENTAIYTDDGKNTLTDEVKSKIGHPQNLPRRRRSMSDFSTDSEPELTNMNGLDASRNGKLLLIMFEFCYFHSKQTRCGQAQKQNSKILGPEEKQESFRHLWQ